MGSPRPAECHPDRPHVARGRCRACYSTWWMAQKRLRRRQGRECSVCRRRWTPKSARGKYCSQMCQKISIAWAKADRRGTHPYGEERYATRDRRLAEGLVRGAIARGCVRMHPLGSGSQLKAPAYYSAWKRAGGLYLVKILWPVPAEGVAA